GRRPAGRAHASHGRGRHIGEPVGGRGGAGAPGGRHRDVDSGGGAGRRGGHDLGGGVRGDRAGRGPEPDQGGRREVAPADRHRRAAGRRPAGRAHASHGRGRHIGEPVGGRGGAGAPGGRHREVDSGGGGGPRGGAA